MELVRVANDGAVCTVLIDDDDYVSVLHKKIHVHRSANGYYAKVGHNLTGRTIDLARYVMECPAGKVVDHINHNPLDNRRCNLRICSGAENQCNRRKLKTVNLEVGSQFKGVHKSGKRWRAQIMHKGVFYPLGSFRLEIEAAEAYNVAAQKYHGEFACLNGQESMDELLRHKSTKTHELSPSFEGVGGSTACY